MSVWKNVVSTSFRSYSIRRQWESVAANVMCVNAGYKGAYLFDHGRADAQTLLAFLVTAKETGLISHLDVLDVGDLIIVHRQTVTTQCVTDERDCFRRISFVDVSPHQEQPSFVSDSQRSMIIEQLRVSTGSLLSALSIQPCTLHRTIAVQLHPCLPLCVLFGYLLGYPIIYWTSDVDPSSGNCLERVSLRRHTAVMSTDEFRDQVVSSFSLPEKLCGSVECQVAKWKEQFTVNSCDGCVVTIAKGKSTGRRNRWSLKSTMMKLQDKDNTHETKKCGTPVNCDGYVQVSGVSDSNFLIDCLINKVDIN